MSGIRDRAKTLGNFWFRRRSRALGRTQQRDRATFNLSRHFSSVSFLLIFVAALALGIFYRQLSLAQLTRLAEDRNVAMTHVFHNSLWPGFAEFVNDSYRQDIGQLRTSPEIERFRSTVITLMRKTDVIKIKAYNRNGLTVLSTDLHQIGESKLDNAGFRSAIAGVVASELVHRNTFDSFEGALEDLDVISSYVPITNAYGESEGVFELYQDVTPFLAYVNRTLWWVAAGVCAVFGILYMLQFLVVRRAQGILRQQGRTLQRYLGEIEQANATLEARVGERTGELEDTNHRLAAEVAERRQAQQQLDHLAYHDPLTGLPNRLLFNQRLGHCLARAGRIESLLALLFIDLDQFKNVNDTLGHHVGDALLVEVARRLSSNARAAGTLARLGGDEFVYVVEDVDGRDEVGKTAERILKLFAQPFSVAGHELFLSASVGISLYPEDGEDAVTLQRNADTAMYQAKAHGRNRHHFYTPEMTAYAQERATIEGLLHRSIERGELSVHFQPQVDVMTGRLTGAEALVRWHSAELGEVAPIRFIGIAEEIGYIVPLGEWVLRESCRQFVAWRERGFLLPRVSVNLSVKQLERPDAIDVIGGILAETGMQPEWLELEITESVIMLVEDAFKLLDRLRGLGIQLSVDDFGTGYSSLNYLKLLPIQKLKIDRSFVIGIGRSRGDEAIIRTVLALARSLDLQVVAEGVETVEQQAFLRGEGCDQIQGYLHGRPVEAAAFFSQWRGAAAAGGVVPGADEKEAAPAVFAAPEAALSALG